MASIREQSNLLQRKIWKNLISCVGEHHNQDNVVIIIIIIVIIIIIIVMKDNLQREHHHQDNLVQISNRPVSIFFENQ